MGVIALVETKEELAVLKRSPAAALPTKHIDIFHEAVAEDGVEWLRTNALIELNLGHEELSIFFIGLVGGTSRLHDHEIIAKGVFEGK